MHGQGGGEPSPALAHRPSGRLRRQHGFQPPLHPLQIVGWLTLAAFVAGSYFVIVPGLPHHAQPAAAAAVSILFLVHLSVNLLAGLLDPAEEALRLRELKLVPSLDRTKHTHVIELGYCHLCGIEVSNSKTKHCSACNKCVANFDHHCKWLNHCIGGRNYAPFLMCVSSAVAAAILIFALAVTNLVYHKSFDPDTSQGEDWEFGGNSTEDDSTLKPFNSTNSPIHSSLPSSDAAFLAIVAALGLLAAVTAGLLLHLCFFHIYISFLGLTTYEYIRQQRQNHSQPTTGQDMSLQQQSGSVDEIRRVKNGSILRRRPIDLQCDGDTQTRTFFSCTVVEESFSSNCTSEPTPTPPSTPQTDCQMCIMTNNSVAPETLKVPPKKVYKKWSCCLSGVPDSPDSPSEPKCLMSLCRHKAKSKKLPPVIEGRPHAHRTHGHWSSAKIRLLFRVLGNLGQNRRRNQAGQTKSNQVGSEVSGNIPVGSIQTVSNLVPVQYPDGSRRAGSLPSLQNPPRRRLISETELANALTLLQQQQQRCGSTTRRPSYRTRRRRSVAHHRPKSPTLSPIRESGLSNPASPSRQSCTVGALNGTCT